MSDQESKEKHSKRIHNKETAVKRQVKIAKTNLLHTIDKTVEREPHRFAKHHAMNCGNPDCVMCGNPRKTFKELTKQEMSFAQTEKWAEVNTREQ